MANSNRAENANSIQRGRPFERGKSGNPKGRPKGSRNQATLLAEQLLDGEAEALVRKLINSALEGDTGALRMCLDRLVAPKRERRIAFELPVKIEFCCRRGKSIISGISRVRCGNPFPGRGLRNHGSDLFSCPCSRGE